MKKNKEFSKRFLSIFLLSAALTLSVLFLIYRIEVKSRLTYMETRDAGVVSTIESAIYHDINTVLSDLKVLREINEVEQFLDAPSPVIKAALAKEFLAFSEGRRLYDQIRLLDEKGMEVVRVDFNNGNPSIVRDDKLQDKAGRYYFTETFRQPRGEMYISPFDLNVENDQVEQPLKPIIRIGTPVFDSQGRKRGIIILNYLGSDIINDVKELSNHISGHAMLVNPEGYWLVGQRTEDEWGFMFRERQDRKIENVFPDAWKQIAGTDFGQFYDANRFFVFKTIRPVKTLPGSKDYYWKLIINVHPEMLRSISKDLDRGFLTLSVFFMILQGIGAWYFASAWTRKKEAEDALHKAHDELEASVHERTEELEVTTEELRSSNEELEKEIVERTDAESQLSRFNKLYLVLSKINEAVVRISGREKLFEEACRIIVEDGGFQMSWIGIVDQSTLLVKPTVYYDREHEGAYIKGIVVSVKDTPEGRGPIGKVIRGGEHIIANDIENDPSMAPWRDKALRYGYQSSAAFPLRMGNDVIGTLTVYSGEPFYFNREEVELLDTLAADLSFAIESIEAETQAKLANEEINLLQSISSAVSEADNFHSALKVALARICEAIVWNFGEVWLPSADGQILEFDASYYSDGRAAEFVESSKTFKFQPGVGLPGRVWSSKKAEWLKDVTADISIFPRADVAVKAGLKAGFGVPIVAGERVLAVLEFFTFKPCEEDGRLLDLISTVSAQLGNIFLRKLSEERLLQSNNLLKTISRAQSEFILDINTSVLFEGLLKDLLHLTGSEYGFIGEIFYDTESNPYLKSNAITNIAWNDETRALYEKYAPAFEFRNLKSLFGEVMTTGKTVISNTPATDPRRCGLPAGHPPLDAFLGLPFYSGNNIIGMVGIANRQNGYDDEMVEYLQPFLSTCSNIITAYRVKKEHREAMEALARSEANLANAQKLAHMGSWQLDITKDELIWSDETYRIFKTPIGTPLSYEKFLEAAHPDDREYVDKAWAGALKRAPYDIEHRILLDGETKWVREKAELEFNEKGEVVKGAGTVQDITELKNLQKQLLHSQKMDAVGQLAGGIAHDFNNALTAILGFSNLLFMKRGDDELVRNYTQHIVDAGESAASLVQGILAFSRKQTIIPQPIDITELVRNIEKILLRLIGEDMELKTALSDSSMIVKADPTQIEQVLMNLATNARDAMKDGGVITIGLEQVNLEDEFVKAHGYGESGNYALLSFADTGMGIDEETRKKIFEPFFTTKEVGKGTGLGLAMVYGIVKQHEGFINVYSEPGTGTTFRIYLPLIDLVAEPRKLREIIISPRGTETVLLVEDDEMVRAIILTVLEDSGYHVIVAENGEDAVSKFKENKDRIQLCISDMVMPKMGGRQAFEEMRKIRPDLRVIFMSGYAADKTKGIIDEGLDFISKPVSPSDFLGKVREVLDR